MASPKLVVLFTLFLALIFSRTGADVSVAGGVREGAPVEVTVVDGSDSSAIKIRLDQLKSTIQTIEYHISEKSQELKKKDESIEEKERIIQERSNSIQSLQTEIASLQKEGALDEQEKVGKAHARAGELEKQVDRLTREIETQNKEKVTLKTRVIEAEKQINGLNSKLDNDL
ncbi:structural maintenance of chromosomes protein 2-1-like [Senna tora]|uniref:Structural maintenance of chromosomes protein 2-1-like n=1 Tax=Senna tora TaxID=362788 RepID=A0A834WDM3_9FABA|nr:structural maintenance of chromosomes protein 2-1-like [Senna tora]